MRLHYSVLATMPTQALRDAYVEWLSTGHIEDVVQGGAESGEVIVLDRAADSEPWRVLTRYVFPSREVFDRYVLLHAPRLRAEGIATFGQSVSFERQIGEVVFAADSDGPSDIGEQSGIVD